MAVKNAFVLVLVRIACDKLCNSIVVPVLFVVCRVKAKAHSHGHTNTCTRCGVEFVILKPN